MTSIFNDQHSVIICIGEPILSMFGFPQHILPSYRRQVSHPFRQRACILHVCVCKKYFGILHGYSLSKDRNRLSQRQITVGKFWCIVRKIERLVVVRKLLLISTPTTGNVALVYVLSPNPTWMPLLQLFSFSLLSVCLGNETKLKLSNPWLTFNISVTMPHALTKYIKLLYSGRAIPSQRYLMI